MSNRNPRMKVYKKQPKAVDTNTLAVRTQRLVDDIPVHILLNRSAHNYNFDNSSYRKDYEDAVLHELGLD
jgi:hypothetical protein